MKLFIIFIYLITSTFSHAEENRYKKFDLTENPKYMKM